MVNFLHSIVFLYAFLFLSSQSHAKQKKQLPEPSNNTEKSELDSDSCLNKPYSEYGFVVVVNGDMPFNGVEISKIQLETFNGKKFIPATFQIDEKNARNEYDLPLGIPYTKDTDDKRYDSNDEIAIDPKSLFNAKKNGFRTKLPKNIPSYLLHICSLHRYLGSVLVNITLNRQQPSLNAKVKFDNVNRKVSTDNYVYEFNSDNPVMLGNVKMKNSTGFEEVISDAKFMMIANLPWWAPNMRFREDVIHSLIECWKIGPVRTIIAVGVKLKNFLKILDLHMFSEFVFYEDMFQIPTVIHFPVDADLLFNKGSGVAYSISFPKGKSWSVNSNIPKLPQVPIETLFNQYGPLVKDHNIFTATGSGPFGSFIVVTRVSSNKLDELLPPFRYDGSVFNANHFKYYDWLEYIKGDLGIFMEISGVKEGVYDFGLDFILNLGDRPEKQWYSQISSYAEAL